MKTQYVVVMQCGEKEYHEKFYKTLRGALNYVHDRLWTWRAYTCDHAEWAIERRVSVENDSKLGFAYTTRSCTIAQSKGFSGRFSLKRDRLVEAA